MIRCPGSFLVNADPLKTHRAVVEDGDFTFRFRALNQLTMCVPPCAERSRTVSVDNIIAFAELFAAALLSLADDHTVSVSRARQR